MSGTQVIVDRSRRSRGCVGIGCGTVFGGFGLAFVFAVGTQTFADPDPGGGFLPGSLFLVAIGSVFALIGGTALVFGVRNIWLSRVLGVPTLTIDRPDLLRLGGVAEARFHRAGGSRRVRATPQLNATLICEESATYRQGTDDHTVTHEVHRRNLELIVDPTPGTVGGQMVIAVPLEFPPSMHLRHNKILWSVKVEVHVPGMPDDTSTFGVSVHPVIATGATPPTTTPPGSDPAREPGAPW
jgi:hypothetical protein